MNSDPRSSPIAGMGSSLMNNGPYMNSDQTTMVIGHLTMVNRDMIMVIECDRESDIDNLRLDI